MLLEHVEQTMVALRLAGQGLAQVRESVLVQVEAVLRHALEVPFARHYHGYDPAEAMAAVADECQAALEP
jgi:hypothetical protein